MKKANQKPEDNLETRRHSCSHLMAAVILELWPATKLAIGPAIEGGFYYDFEFTKPLSDNDLPKIETKMAQIQKLNDSFVKKNLSVKEAIKLFANQPYKIELIEDLVKNEGVKQVSIYIVGKFVDLCAGPHVESTQEIGSFKLLSLAGAYWHGDEKNKMLTRIYGTCFPTNSELENYLEKLAEAEKRDHRKLGKELDLFSINPLTGPGLILWHPKLAVARNEAENYWRLAHHKHGYQFVYTPHIASMDMFVISRHYIKYINFMFPAMLHQYIEGESAGDYSTDEQLKPMNCPNHIQIYKSRPRSYRDLPIRMAELGTVYRYERAGTLHGMIRVRGFTQDDSHIFCQPDQVIDEVRGIIRLTKEIYTVFGFKDYQAYLATRPEMYLGTLKMWGFAQDSLKKALEAERVDYKIDEGQGVFYGPKIDSKIKDSLGREWQLGTIQVDFNLPTRAETTEEEIEQFWAMKTFRDKFKTKEKLTVYLKKLGRGFDVKFIGNKGKEQQAVMIHRTIYGSMERFFGILIEHYGGAFPIWLTPVQVKIILVTQKSEAYAKKIYQKLFDLGIRVEINDRNETIPAKIRNAEIEKIPYMAVIGPKEEEKGSVNVRVRGEKVLGLMLVEKFIELLKEDIDKKKQV